MLSVPCVDFDSGFACVQDLVEALSAKNTWFIPRKYDQATWERTPDGQYAGYEEIVPFGRPAAALHVNCHLVTHIPARTVMRIQFMHALQWTFLAHALSTLLRCVANSVLPALDLLHLY